MGEARRRSQQGLPPKKSNNKSDDSSKILPLIPITDDQREKFFAITKTGSWIGIFLLIVFWVVVRFIGPWAGWWTPADTY